MAEYSVYSHLRLWGLDFLLKALGRAVPVSVRVSIVILCGSQGEEVPVGTGVNESQAPKLLTRRVQVPNNGA